MTLQGALNINFINNLYEDINTSRTKYCVECGVQTTGVAWSRGSRTCPTHFRGAFGGKIGGGLLKNIARQDVKRTELRTKQCLSFLIRHLMDFAKNRKLG